MSALDNLQERTFTPKLMTPLDWFIWNNRNFLTAEQAAAELIELRAIKQAAWEFVNADGRHDPQDKYQTLKEMVNK